jgi:hypothetical protein
VQKYVGFTTAVRCFLGYSLLLSFLVLPVLVYFYGRRPYCSWFCGCGCLAETLGDPFRRLTPRGHWSRRLEYSVYPVTLAAIAVTVWVLRTPTSQLGAPLAGMHWYDLIVKFVLASLLGVGLYSLLGARIWRPSHQLRTG